MLGAAVAGLFLGVVIAVAFGILRDPDGKDRIEPFLSRGSNEVEHHRLVATPRDGNRTAVKATTAGGDEQQARDPRDLMSLVENCMLTSSSPDEARTCLQALPLEEVPPDVLGRWVCSSQAPLHIHATVVQEVLVRQQPGDFLPYVNEFQATCTKYKESTFLIGCLEYGRRLHQAWYDGVVATVDPSVLFDESTSEAAIQVCEHIAKSVDGQYTKSLLEEGGKGYWGGTADQIFRAAAIAATVQGSPREFQAYIAEVLDAPGNEKVWNRMGPIFTAFLLSPRAWEGGDSTAALNTVMKALRDRRYGANVAVCLTTFYSEESPAGCDEELWRSVWSLASAVSLVNR